MSRPSIHISITKPCHEQWDTMTATERGAFCQSCQTEVIDFSIMTDREVVEYLSKNKTGCGRFRNDQLNTNLTIPSMEKGLFKWKALLLGFLSFISIKNLVAQSGNIRSTKQNTTVQNDSTVKQQSKPVYLPQVIDTTVVITLGKMRIKEPGSSTPIKRDSTVKGRF